MTRSRWIKFPMPALVLAILGLALVQAGAAWAQPMGRGMCNLTPEQTEKAFDLRQKFMNDTANLRKGMAVKRAELRALWQAEKPDEKAILAKQKELTALKDQFQTKAVPFRLEMQKIVPQAQAGSCPMGSGGGPGGGMGMGRGMGMGKGHGGGFGPGCGW